MQRCLVEECDDRYDQLLLELDILEHLYDNSLPFDVSALLLLSRAATF